MFGVNSATTMYFSQTARDVAQQAKLLYDISPLSTSTLIAFEKNAEYLIEDRKSGLCTVLRVSRPSTCTSNEIYAEIKWIKELEKRSPPFFLPEPVAGIDGNYVQKVPLASGDVCYCTMFGYLNGVPIAGHSASIVGHANNMLIKDLKKLGEMTAIMHQSAIQWQGASNLDRRVLDYSTLISSQTRFGSWNNELLIENEPLILSNELQLLFDRTGNIIKHRLLRFGKSKARFGLIHGDLTLSNIICYKNRFAITHFDNCGFGWFLYDFASTVSFLEDKSYLPQLTAAWLEGYRRQRNISNEEKCEIPTFVMMRRLELLNCFTARCEYTASDGYPQDFIDRTAALAENYLTKCS